MKTDEEGMFPVVVDQKDLTTRVSSLLQIAPDKVAGLIKRYGEETVQFALEIKGDKLTIALHRFQGLVEMGLKPEEAYNLYLTRADFADYVKKQWSVGVKGFGAVSLRQLSRLAVRFEDFRIGNADEQFELVLEIAGIFRWSSFVGAVNRILEVSDRVGFNSLNELLLAAEDFVTGEVFGTYYSDDDPADHDQE